MKCDDCKQKVNELLHIGINRYCFNCIKKNHLNEVGEWWQGVINTMRYYKKKTNEQRLKYEMDLVAKKDIDMENIFKPNLLISRNKRLYTKFKNRIYNIESNLGANINHNKDLNENYRYNKLRGKYNV